MDYKGRHYPDFEAATGYGTGAGLCGWNACHTFFAVFPELGDPPQWTQEQLRELNARNIEWNGKKYTAYEISQMQRARERNVRRWKSGIWPRTPPGWTPPTARCHPESSPPEPCRVCTGHGGRVDSARVGSAQVRQERSQQGSAQVRKAYTNQAASAILDTSNKIGVNPDVNFVCKLDKELYKVITEDIRTDEVIITDERIQHIQERHPDDYERFSTYPGRNRPKS